MPKTHPENEPKALKRSSLGKNKDRSKYGISENTKTLNPFVSYKSNNLFDIITEIIPNILPKITSFGQCTPKYNLDKGTKISIIELKI